MFSFARSIEILLFALCNFSPYVALSVYAFHKHLRFSKAITALACFFMFFIQFATRYWSALHGMNSNVYLSIFRLFIFIFGYSLLFDRRFFKVLFLELVFANIGNFILIAAVCLERNLFPNIEHSLYCWHTSVVMLLLHLILTIPLTHAIRKFFIPMLDNDWVKKEWNYYWLVPTVFYIIWQYQVNGGAVTGLEHIQNPYNVVVLFIVNLGSIIIYYIMLKLDGQLAKNLQLEEQRHYQELENVEYHLIHERMEESRRLRHDLRHHIRTMSHYLEEKEYDKLRDYLGTYSASIPDAQTIEFCQHRVINSLIFHFALQAREQEIDFDAQVSISEDMSMNEHDISVLLGNLLENAIDACSDQQEGKRCMIIRATGDSHSLTFTIDNTFSNQIIKDKGGNFLTTKEAGSGIGVTSAKGIVKRYNGIFSADVKGEMFCVSFMLHL